MVKRGPSAYIDIVLRYASLSVCLRDSAYALHLRHTTECVLQRVLCVPVLSWTGYLRLLILRWAMGHFPEGFHRFIWLCIQYTQFFAFVNGYSASNFVTVFSAFVFPCKSKYDMIKYHTKKENIYASDQKRLHQNHGRS